MQQIFNQLLSFLQQGISAIFRFVQLIGSGPSARSPVDARTLAGLAASEADPAGVDHRWRRLGFVQGRQGAVGGRRILTAFAALLGVLVKTLPSVDLAGLIALGGVWVLNNLDVSALQLPSFLQLSSR